MTAAQDPECWPQFSPESLAAQAGHYLDAESGAIVPPIQPATTFARDAGYRLRQPSSYSRYGTPAWDLLESTLARLEGGKAAAVFASGMAAAMAVVSALRPGDRIVAHAGIYWALRRFMTGFAARWGIGLDLADLSEPAALRPLLQPGKTRLVWLETPANPLWELLDIAALAAEAKAAGACTLVDSTVATPVLTRPLALGADLVLHSATKYLNGHSDLLAGLLVTAETGDLWREILANRAGYGGTLGSFEAWLLLRGLRTLFPRVRQACASAQQIARTLQDRPDVAAVLYPGLPDHPGHALAARQMQGGFGGMLSLRLAGGYDAAARVCRKVRLFHPATSLGSVESLIEHRRTIEGEGSAVSCDLLRLSIGMEAPADLIADLEHALAP
ncbi:MAG: PLP-dependent transferase [Rhodospirillales bacterium]|nr:PLP-dependent transferase [Rhodospirillales bacterium]